MPTDEAKPIKRDPIDIALDELIFKRLREAVEEEERQRDEMESYKNDKPKKEAPKEKEPEVVEPYGYIREEDEASLDPKHLPKKGNVNQIG